MTATVARTVAELAEIHPDVAAGLAAGLAVWEAVGLPPFGLGDLFEELELPGAAACARWAAVQGMRPDHAPFEGRIRNGLLPMECIGNKGFIWSIYQEYTHSAHAVPLEQIDVVHEKAAYAAPTTESLRFQSLNRARFYFPSVRAALIHLLDNWKV